MKQIPKVQALKNILILRGFDSLSDALISSCCYREIKKANPAVKLTVACFRTPYDYFLHNPYVDDIVLLRHGGAALWMTALKLRAQNFDLVLDTSHRQGLDWKWLKKLVGGNRLLDSSTSPIQPFGAPGKHGTEHEHAILKLLGIANPDRSYDLPIPTTTRQTVENWLAEQHLSSYILLNPAGTAKVRQFRPNTLHNIATACNHWQMPFVVPVRAADAGRWQEVFSDMPQVHIKEIASIFESFELVRRAVFIITPDTVAVSVAAAFEKPILVFYNHLTAHNAPDNPHAFVLQTANSDVNQFKWEEFAALVQQIKSSL